MKRLLVLGLLLPLAGCGFFYGYSAASRARSTIMNSPSLLGGNGTTEKNLQALAGVDGDIDSGTFFTERGLCCFEVRISKPKTYRSHSAHLQWLFNPKTGAYRLSYAEVGERPVVVNHDTAEILGWYPEVYEALSGLTERRTR